MDVHIELKTFLFFLLVLFVYGSEGAREMTTNVLRLPSMDADHVHAKDPSPSSSHMDHIDPSMLVFFQLKDLKIGNKMKIYFPNIKDSSSKSPPLLSKNEANSIPFSSKQLPYLLKYFSFSPNSQQAKAMEHTLKECEIKPIKGETKLCPTSLESMLDYVHETFGSNTKFKILSTKHLIKSNLVLDNYTILKEPIEIPVPKMVACHTMPYPYSVYYCHSQKTENKVFLVSLEGDNGGRVDAVSVCHMDTSQWSRNHASFRVLGIEPGSSHVCHFFRADHLVFVTE